jgi:hypothetical protein
MLGRDSFLCSNYSNLGKSAKRDRTDEENLILNS